MANRTQSQHDVAIGAASTQAYANINTVLSISEPEPTAKFKRGKLSSLIVYHILCWLESEGVDHLPYAPGSAKPHMAEEMADDFIAAYADELWPDRECNDDKDAELGIAVQNYIFVMLTVRVKASEVKDERTALIEQFRGGESSTSDELSSSAAHDSTSIDPDDVVDELFCLNCGKIYRDLLSIETHFRDCLPQFRAHYSSGPFDPNSIPRIFYRQ